MFIPKEDKYTAPFVRTIPRSPLKFIWVFSKRHKYAALVASLAVVVASSLVSAMGLVYKFLVDSILSENYQVVKFLVLGYPALWLVEAMAWRISGFMGMRWATRVEYDVYNSLVSYSLRHSHNYFINRFAGSLLSKVDNVAESSIKMIHDYLWSHLETGVLIFTSFTLVFLTNVTVGFYCVALLVVLTIYNWKITPRQTAYSLKNAQTYTTLRGHIVDTFTNITAVRHHTANQREEGRLAKLAHESRIAHRNSWFFSEINVTINMLILFCFATLIMFTLHGQWVDGNITAGDLVLVITVFFTLTGSLSRLGRAFNDTAKAYGKMSEGLNELVVDYEVEDLPSAKKMKANRGVVSWDKVEFEYGQNKVFNKFDLKIESGQRIGLVGPSGAGKTTFVSLLLRQHDIQSGSIEIDGQNIAEVTQDSLREAISVVPQEPLLFHRTIRENIAYGKSSATKKEIETVAKKAQAHEFISELPEGYDTLVGERGVKLSGGQKQRVAIARAMLKDAPILVLDEATSALDSESEVEIQKALKTLMKGKTVVAIAHRLSTLREMDRILVLENGKIKEDGTHQELTQAGGTYQRLWEHQAGGFLKE